MLTLDKKPKVNKAEPYHELEPTKALRELIERVARASVQDGLGGLRHLRGFALFEAKKVHILKPLSLRQWAWRQVPS